MIERQHGNVIFICDWCGKDLDTNTSQWDTALKMSRDEKWKAIFDEDDDTYKNMCPDCMGGAGNAKPKRTRK